MGIDWKLLVQVRERQRHVAQQAVAQERRTTEERAAAAESAHAEVQQQIAAKAELWFEASSSTALSVASLRQTSAWSRSLDSGIQRAAESARAAQHELALQMSRLEERRAQLRHAAGDVCKAQEMDQRDVTQRRHAADVRLDHAADDAATQGWSAEALRTRGR